MSDTTAMTDTTDGNEDNRAIAALAHALWMAELGKAVPADVEGRKAAWRDAKREKMRIAKMTLRRLEKRGYSLSAGGDAGGEDDLT